MAQEQVTIRAIPVKGEDLKPGDLFSTEGPNYWHDFGHLGSIGERVYIRTNQPSQRASDSHMMVYRIEIVKPKPDSKVMPLFDKRLKDPAHLCTDGQVRAGLMCDVCIKSVTTEQGEINVDKTEGPITEDDGPQNCPDNPAPY